MLNLDQVRLLENRVEKAVGKIQSLGQENTRLRNELSTLQTRVVELESLVNTFKDDQGRIEEGILNALDRLSAFEDSVFNTEISTQPDTNIEVENPVYPVPQTDNSLDIQPEWQDEPIIEKTDVSSADGQMDIF
ncbi:MAG: cell division protein ZapB [Spirochaetales bacterium]|nr:cell division protein ZapB [Spirochaetales bacterium]HNQ97059.1 cell division protein ZapB [Treponemataceae bacterium]